MPMLLLEMLAGTKVRLGGTSWLVQVPLLIHISGGIAALVFGFLALGLAKGGDGHRRSGRAFVYAMVVMGTFGAAIAAYENNIGSLNSGFLAAYFVVTAMLTVRPWTNETRRVMTGAAIFAAVGGLLNFSLGINAMLHGVFVIGGAPIPVVGTIIGCITLAAARSDWRLIRQGGLTGTPRLVRHIWRMCFALFVASGSFFLGQAQVIPKAYRYWPALFLLAFLPLLAMVYWLWRVKLRKSLRGLVIRDGSRARSQPLGAVVAEY